MMSSKLKSKNQSDPDKVSGVIVNKAVENLRKGSTKQAQSRTNEAVRQQKIATAVLIIVAFKMVTKFRIGLRPKQKLMQTHNPWRIQTTKIYEMY